MDFIGDIKMNYNEKYSTFYNSKEWKILRKNKWESSNGLCEKCLEKGIVKSGVEVHHKIPIKKNWSKRLDYDNLILLCKECHNDAHNRISPLQKFLKEWDKEE